MAEGAAQFAWQTAEIERQRAEIEELKQKLQRRDAEAAAQLVPGPNYLNYLLKNITLLGELLKLELKFQLSNKGMMNH